MMTIAKKMLLLAVALSLPIRTVPAAKAFAVEGQAKATVRLSGRVSVAGSYPTPKALPVFKNRAFCGPQVVNETLLIGRDGGL